MIKAKNIHKSFDALEVLKGVDIEIAKEEQLLKEIDDDMLWFDLTYLLNEPQERAAPEIHITIDYTVRAFEETEKEYLELYSFFTH
jgi:hypothetical protein